ncbi:ead/Ea22-like family protein [Enterobacter kobei]
MDKRALRKAAEQAGADEWCAFIDTKSKTYSVHTPGDNRCGDVVKWAGFDGQQRAAAKVKFISAANPATVLALLDELESMSVQIANLTAERDALREGEMGDAKHSNTRAAADIYFQLVEECEIPAGGSLVEYVSELRERAAMLHGADGNSPVIPDGWVMVPVDMSPEMTRSVQVNSELGAYSAANLTGAYSLFREFWDVAVTAALQQQVNT